MKRLFIAEFLLLLCAPLLADEEETHDMVFTPYPAPWFTGPLIAPSGYTVEPGHFAFQPYFDAFTYIGKYASNWKVRSLPNFYNVNLRARFKAGIFDWMDAQITPQFLYQQTGKKLSSGFGDLLFSFNFQLLNYKIEDPWPSLRLNLQTSIPTGKYQKLNPSLLETDARGNGCWYPEIAAVLSKLWHLTGIHYLEARLFTGYRIGTPVSVQGESAYGGDPSTRGVAYPGNIYFADLAFQYNFTQNFAFACDCFYRHLNKSRFSGRTAKNAAPPSKEEFSFAPALEYNWSKKIGAIGGVWFSAAGRNSPQFINGILSANAYF